MVESIYTVEFLNSLSNELKSQLEANLQVEREFRVALRGDKSQGFIYDIGIISNDHKRLILIEIELGGKTPIYNLMKTVYWHTLSKDKPDHVLFLHIFSTDPKSKNRHVPEDMTEFTKQLIIKDMFDYKHINFSQLTKLHELKNKFLIQKDVTPIEAKQDQRRAEKLVFNRITNAIAPDLSKQIVDIIENWTK